jgi:integrase
MTMGTIPKKIRESAGGAYESRGKLFLHITDRPQHRTSELCGPWCLSLDEAKARARRVQSWVNRLRLAGETSSIVTAIEQGALADDEETLSKIGVRVDALTSGTGFDRIESKDGPVTFQTFAERWTGGELARLYPDHVEVKASVADDIERLTKHVYPHVGGVLLAKFARGDADRIMMNLPAALKKSTRRHVAQLVSRVLHLAVFTEAIAHHPLPRGWLPKVPNTSTIAKESLLPSEEAKLLAGRSPEGKTVVPLEYRVAYLFLHREGMRKGEAEKLVWPDLDLERGMVALDENKTDRPRSWVLDAGVASALSQWKAIQGGRKASGAVFTGVQWGQLAHVYRRHCEAVGITRGRLFERKANKLQLRAHDMRAFFITSGMFAGRDALWITDRSGHTTLGMLRTYERDVRRWRELGEAPAPAELAIPEFCRRVQGGKRGGKADSGETGDDVTKRNYASKAEVAEWQTQRTQNPPSERA